MFEVAVIGAGPAGSMCARLLAQQGHSVILIEAHTQPGDQVNCSGIIGLEAFDHFELPASATIRTIDSFLFRSPAGRVLEYRHDKPLAIAVDRSRFDHDMAMRAVSSGACLKTETRINTVRLEKHHVDLLTQQGEKIRCKFLVIATGAGSPIPRQIGLGVPDKFVLGSQAVCETDIQDVEIFLGSKYAPSNFAWAIPLQKGYAKIGLICPKDGTNSLHDFLLRLRSSGHIRSHDRILCSVLPLSPLKRSFAHRTIVIGEAAGQIKTITCGGIYYALLAAEIGSDVLGEAIQQNVGNANVLSKYESRWRALLWKELRMGLRFRTLFEKLSDTRIDSLFEIAEKDGIMKLIREKVNFDWHRDLVSSILRHAMVRAVLRPGIYGSLLIK